MLYTLILFVGLFIAATTVAVIYYIKFEDQRTIAENAQSDLQEIVSPSELQRIGTIVGAKQPRKSRIATMVEYLDNVVYLIIGGLPEDTSAEVKVGNVNRSFTDTLTLAQTHIDEASIDPNTTGLVQIVQKLKTELDNIKIALQITEEQLAVVRNDFNDAMVESMVLINFTSIMYFNTVCIHVLEVGVFRADGSSISNFKSVIATRWMEDMNWIVNGAGCFQYSVTGYIQIGTDIKNG